MSERIDGTENANGSNGLLPNRDVLGRTNADSIHDSASRETTANEDSGTSDASSIVVPKRHAAMRVMSIDDDENANGNPTHDGMKPIGETHNIAQDAVSGTKPRHRVRTKQAIGDGSSEHGGKIERTVASRNRGVTQGTQHADSTTSDEKGTASHASQSSMASDTPDGMHYDAASAVRNVLTDDTSSEMMHDGMVPSTERTDALSIATADVARDDALRHAPTKTGGDDDAPRCRFRQKVKSRVSSFRLVDLASQIVHGNSTRQYCSLPSPHESFCQHQPIVLNFKCGITGMQSDRMRNHTCSHDSQHSFVLDKVINYNSHNLHHG